MALVTGASRGIGREHRPGAGRGRLDGGDQLSGQRGGGAGDLAEAVKARGGQKPRGAGRHWPPWPTAPLVTRDLEKCGRLDVLVNNAGMAPRQRTDLLQMTEASYDEVMAVNLKGPFFLTQRVANVMVELLQQGRIHQPKIVNIGSVSAYTASINRGEYCISKAGMGMMTALFADRLAAYGILVYEVRPGIIDTDMTSVVKGSTTG